MNWKQIFRLSGTMQGIICLCMIIPTIMAYSMGEMVAFRSFLITIAIIVVYIIGIFSLGRRWKAQPLTIKDIYLFVTLTWIIASALGALPLYLSKSVPYYSHAFMEIMSGFTTTGLTTLIDIEVLPYSILFWRSFTHWLGGMGIIVLFVALLPLFGSEGVQLFGAEAVGPIKSKLTPKIKNTALILWIIYVGMSLLETVLLLLAGLSLYDALTVTFGTVATGGFVTKNASIGHYQNISVDIIVTIFMVLAGVNFSLYFALIRKKITTVWRDTELRIYVTIFLLTTIAMTLILNRGSVYSSFFESLRYGAFHVASIMTTTGYAIADYGLWPSFAQALILFLMFVGGCAGSTGGGIKVTRLITMFKLARQNIRVMLHPKGVFSLQTEHERIPWRAVNGIAGFVTVYLTLVLVGTLTVASAGYDLLSSFGAGLITVGNIGLGIGEFGPAGGGFHAMPSFAKWILSLLMLAGRLEIYTVFALFTRSFWRK